MMSDWWRDFMKLNKKMQRFCQINSILTWFCSANWNHPAKTNTVSSRADPQCRNCWCVLTTGPGLLTEVSPATPRIWIFPKCSTKCLSKGSSTSCTTRGSSASCWCRLANACRDEPSRFELVRPSRIPGRLSQGCVLPLLFVTQSSCCIQQISTMTHAHTTRAMLIPRSTPIS